MSKALEKSLKDARKEGRLTLGAKRVLEAAKDSRMVVISRSAGGNPALARRIESDAKANDVPLIHYNGTSVALGRMCGLQFRASAVSFSEIAEASIGAIMKESEPGAQRAGSGR